MRSCCASQKRAEWRHLDPWHLLELADPAPAAPLLRPAKEDTNTAEIAATAAQPKAGLRVHRWKMNRVVLSLDEHCAVVCRNQSTIQLPAEFHLQAAFCGTGKCHDRDMQGIRQEHAILNQKRYTWYMPRTSFEAWHIVLRFGTDWYIIVPLIGIS